ncbi:MAG: plasmid pRiA4b ORF-3 family protein [Candidatus Helarchaeota archaeon]
MEKDIPIFNDLVFVIEKGLSKFDKKKKLIDILNYGEDGIEIRCSNKKILKNFLNFLFEHSCIPKIELFVKEIKEKKLLKKLLSLDILLSEINFAFKEKLPDNEKTKLIRLAKKYNFFAFLTDDFDFEKNRYFISFSKKGDYFSIDEKTLEVILKVDEIFDLLDVGIILTKDFSNSRSYDITSFNNVFQFKITLFGNGPPIWRRIQVPEIYTFRDLHVAIQNAMGWNTEHIYEFHMINPKTRFKAEILFGDECEALNNYSDDCMIYIFKNREEIIKIYKNIIKLKKKGELRNRWKKIKQNIYSDIDINLISWLPYNEMINILEKNIPSVKEYIKHRAMFLILNNKKPIEYYLDIDTKISDFFTEQNNKCHYIYDLGDYWDHLIEFEGKFPRKEKLSYPICMDGERACPFENSGGVDTSIEYYKIIQDPTHPEHDEILRFLNRINHPHWIGKIEQYDPSYFNKDEVYFEDPKRYMRRVTSRDYIIP